MNILYEDNALVVLNKPAGLSSEEGVPAALRENPLCARSVSYTHLTLPTTSIV